jgi:flavodoxin/ferredoxin
MKTLIIYFSQTGNTRKIADCIRDGIIDVTGQCDIMTITEAEPSLFLNYDLIGLGSPVFYYKEPFNVKDFIEAFPDLKAQHWFVFCTHGNVIGNFFPSVTQRLKKKGAIVIGFHNTYANITVPFYPKPSYTSGHPDVYDLYQAKNFDKEVADRSPKITNENSALIPDPAPVSSEEWIEDSISLSGDILDQVLPKLRINKDTCIQCHECEGNCPVRGIDIDADPPRLQTPCIFCWQCVNVCPTLSIEADWRSLVAMAPDNYARYKKELDKASAS